MQRCGQAPPNLFKSFKVSIKSFNLSIRWESNHLHHVPIPRCGIEIFLAEIYLEEIYLQKFFWVQKRRLKSNPQDTPLLISKKMGA